MQTPKPTPHDKGTFKKQLFLFAIMSGIIMAIAWAIYLLVPKALSPTDMMSYPTGAVLVLFVVMFWDKMKRGN